MFSLIEKEIATGFLYGFSLEKRKSIINSDITKSEFYKLYGDKVKQADVDLTLHWLENTKGAFIWKYGEPDYPLTDGLGVSLPYNLFCLGNKTNLRNIGIIGTRHASYSALKRAYSLGLELNLNSFRVISGMAEGCDQSALAASIDASTRGMGVAAISVLAHGFSVNYPSNSSGLKSALIDNNGLIISQFPPSMPPLKYNFLYRNFLISVLCDALINIQSPKKSGANITLELALDLGKDVFISDVGCLDDEFSSGSRTYYLDGCKKVTHVTDICSSAKIRVEERSLSLSDNARSYFRFGNAYYSVEN